MSAMGGKQTPVTAAAFATHWSSHYRFLVSDRPPPQMPFRLGCGLALIISVSLVVAFAAALGWMRDRPIDLASWDYFAWELATVGAPFFVLAAARVADWLAWFIAIVLTAGLYAYLLYDLSLHRGVNFLLGFVVMIIAPVVISGLCLIVAGLRGRVPWARE